MGRHLFCSMAAVAFLSFTSCSEGNVYNVRDYGAKGDGITLDSPAINQAIEAAAQAGGGTVLLPKGVYASYSIRLKDNITLLLKRGAVLKAAQYTDEAGFDEAEPNAYYSYQDFGHSHWKNSLIWGIGLENVTICGVGKIDGALLSDGFRDAEGSTVIDCDFRLKPGTANKAIALKECKNVVVKDITVDNGGHFCILATGVEGMTLSGLTLDSERDGIDIDGCRDVVVENCTINTPWDDALVMKTSYALGRYAPCENIRISHCSISGYARGTMLSGEHLPVQPCPQHPSVEKRSSGRIKCGTESSGDFRNIKVSHCTLEYCGGLHVESTDGAVIDSLSYDHISIKDCADSPIFVMIGSRLRSPEGRSVGSISHLAFSNIESADARADYGVIITGYKDHYVSDVSFNNVSLHSKGGMTPADAISVVKEIENEYPDPKMFGVMPSCGMYVRHVRGLVFNHVDFAFAYPDSRPLFVKEDCL